jgi:hypothetical protein
MSRISMRKPRPENYRKGSLKKRKGLAVEPLSAIPQFTPSRKLRDITTTPGKISKPLCL